MKTARRLWLAWLALPEVIRMAAVVALAIFIGMALPHAARGEEAVLSNGRNVIHLSQNQCTHAATLAMLKPEWRAKFKDARATIDGRLWSACWLLKDDGTVHLVFEDGDETDVPMAVFRSDPGV